MNRSKEFWGKIYHNISPKMLGICRRYVSDKQTAEDLMHDAFITAINKYDSFKGIGSIEAWLRKITVNTVLMYIRSQNAKKYFEDYLHPDMEEMEDTFSDNERKIIESSDFSENDLLQIIDALPQHHKLVFNLYVIDKYSHADIAKTLSISIGTSKSHLSRARKKIKKLLYEKAVLKKDEQQKDQKKNFFLLFIFSSKSKYIDKLFKKRFSEFSIDSDYHFNEQFQTIDWNKTISPSVNTFLGLPKIGIWIIVSGGIVIFSILLYNRKNEINPIRQETDSVHFKMNYIPYETDSLFSIKDTIVSENQNNDSLPIKPVVVKKTKIIRQTVTIRDTVKIIDTLP